MIASLEKKFFGRTAGYTHLTTKGIEEFWKIWK